MICSPCACCMRGLLLLVCLAAGASPGAHKSVVVAFSGPSTPGPPAAGPLLRERFLPTGSASERLAAAWAREVSLRCARLLGMGAGLAWCRLTCPLA